MHEVTRHEPATTPAPPPLGPILVVEDDDLIREVVVTWLRMDGWVAIEAADAKTAIRLAAEAQPAVAICDVNLKGGPDGAWLSMQLHGIDPSMAIIFATGEPELPPTLTLRPGVIGYLLKPYGRRQVLDQLRAAVATVTARRSRAQTESELEAECIHRRQTLTRSIARVKATGAVDIERAAAALLSNPDSDRVEAKKRLASLAAMFGLDVMASGLTVAARFRNLGREAVPGGLLEEPRHPQAFERRLVRQCPLEGAEALDSLGWHDAAAILWSLREQWNGLGYPFQMVGDEIPLAARVLAVFDTFEAVTAERPHRRALNHAEAIDLLRSGAGAAFDPAVVDAFITLVDPTAGKASCY